eukprot:scaffold64_cov338-Pavlova_lutheri.AAC.30
MTGPVDDIAKKLPIGGACMLFDLASSNTAFRRRNKLEIGRDRNSRGQAYVFRPGAFEKEGVSVVPLPC